MKYRVVFSRTEVYEEYIDAKSVDDAQEKWESEGHDAELVFIEDENKGRMYYD